MAGTIRRKPPAPTTTPGAIPVKPRPKRKPPNVDPVSPVVGVPILGSFGNASIDQWDTAFVNAVDAVKDTRGVWVDPHVLKAMMDVESGGDGNYPPTRCRPSDGYDNVPACGPMQIKWQYHQQRCPECDSKTVAGQIEMAAHIIGMTMLERDGTEYDAITAVYFPGGDVNGTTQKAYVDRVRSLVGIMEQDAGGTTPAPKPKPPIDPISVIVGGASHPPIDYGWRADAGLSYYAYGVGHGTTSATQHTGYDVGVECGTRLFSPIAGVVDCVGNAGTPRWGQGCGAYADVDGGGTGNITIFGDSGLKLTLGHCHSARVSPGQRVAVGQQVGTSGSMNGCHVHVEVSVLRNGAYWLVDPGPALVEAMGGKAPAIPVERIPYDLDNDPNLFTVEVVAETLAVRQRADPQAPELDGSPYKKGEVFKAVCLVPGNDGRPWWLGTLDGRVPANGTRSNAFPKGF